jgi:hypothetical protein
MTTAQCAGKADVARPQPIIMNEGQQRREQALECLAQVFAKIFSSLPADERLFFSLPQSTTIQ